MQIIILITLIISNLALGWGFQGHKTIASLAKHQLTPTTITQIKQLQHKDSFEKLSIWPDTIRTYYPHTTSWHYTVIDTNNNIKSNKKNGVIYNKLCENINLLTQPKSQHWQDQRQALSWIIHLISDMHQPLHIGNGKDFGGNNCNILWYNRKKPINLHKIWDTYLVKHTLRNNPNLKNKTINPALIDTSPLKWMQESRQLHKIIYPKNPNKYCHRQTKNLPHLSESYAKKMSPIIATRIYLAAYRLALTLNYIFDKDFQNTHSKPKIISICNHKLPFQDNN